MAREKREISSTGMYHILLRGIDELFSKDEDFKEFSTVLESFFEGKNAKLLGYSLLKNRVHIVIDEGDMKISAIIKPICTSYARYFNRVNDLQGKLFYDRYKSEPIESQKELSEVKGFLKNINSKFSGGLEDGKAVRTLSFIDDYCRMTDEELKDYIETIFNVKIADMSKDEKRALAEEIIAGGKISGGRIYTIFGLGRKQPAKASVAQKKEKAAPKKAVAKKPAEKKEPEKKEHEKKEPEKKEEPKKNGGLSVWLL